MKAGPETKETLDSPYPARDSSTVCKSSGMTIHERSRKSKLEVWKRVPLVFQRSPPPPKVRTRKLRDWGIEEEDLKTSEILGRVTISDQD